MPILALLMRIDWIRDSPSPRPGTTICDLSSWRVTKQPPYMLLLRIVSLALFTLSNEAAPVNVSPSR